MGDRRRHLRFDKVFTVYISTPDGLTRGIARNISATGLFVETREPMPLGGRVRVTFTGEDGTEMVLVNLYHEPLGAPMTYRAAKDFFDRLARACGFAVRPHMLRHTAATSWVRAGTDLDVVQALLGHMSLASTTVYLHARDEDKRRAVEAVAAGRRYR